MKRRFYKKKVYRRKRRTLKKYRRTGFRSKKNTYHYKRYANLGTFVVGNLTPTFASIDFALQQVPDNSDFTNLYDSYRINAVKVTFRPQQTESISIGSINNPAAYARFISAIDYNDISGVTSMDELRQYQSCKVTSVLKPHRRYIYHPRIQDRGFTYTPGRPWINCTSPDQTHFGLKVGADPINSTTTTTMTYTIEAVFYMSFKYVR